MCACALFKCEVLVSIAWVLCIVFTSAEFNEIHSDYVYVYEHKQQQKLNFIYEPLDILTLFYLIRSPYKRQKQQQQQH